MSNPEGSIQKIDNSELINKSFRNLKVYICTWNVNTRNPRFKLTDLIAFKSQQEPDICVFGFQEINTWPVQMLFDYFRYDPWTNQLTNLLYEKNYVRIRSSRLFGNLMIVFVKKTLVPYVKYCGEEWIRLGFGGYWGNKGANICILNIGSLNVAFVNSHLSAHQEQDKTRLIEHTKVLYHKFKFGNKLESVIDQEYLFLFGDLNFRTENISLDEVKEIIKNNKIDKLLNYDQLRRCIRDEECFYDFKESLIHFPPTYKFKLNTDIYDLSKKNRVPSWCDRILYKITHTEIHQQCNPLEYNSITTFNQSDHKPVYGQFEITVQNWENEAPSVHFSEITSSKEQDLEAFYHVNKHVTTHSNDWIGVFDSKFKSSVEYLTYIWAPRIAELETNTIKRNHPLKEVTDDNYIKKKLVVDQYYLKSGNFVLGYFSYVSHCLIGVSNSFELKFD